MVWNILKIQRKCDSVEGSRVIKVFLCMHVGIDLFQSTIFAPTSWPYFWLSDGHFSSSNYCVSGVLDWWSSGRKLRNVFTAVVDSINICAFSSLEKLRGRWISWWGWQKNLELVKSLGHLASRSTWLSSFPQSIPAQQSLRTSLASMSKSDEFLEGVH